MNNTKHSCSLVSNAYATRVHTPSLYITVLTSAIWYLMIQMLLLLQQLIWCWVSTDARAKQQICGDARARQQICGTTSSNVHISNYKHIRLPYILVWPCYQNIALIRASKANNSTPADAANNWTCASLMLRSSMHGRVAIIREPGGSFSSAARGSCRDALDAGMDVAAARRHWHAASGLGPAYGLENPAAEVTPCEYFSAWVVACLVCVSSPAAVVHWRTVAHCQSSQ